MCFGKIKKILNPEILEHINQEKKCVKLKESSPGSHFPGVEILNIHEESVVFKLDKDKKEFKKKSFYLSDKPGLHAGCDYVIFTKYRDKNAIILCELKSKRSKGASAQLRNSIPFIDYLASLLKIHYDIELNSLFEQPRYIIFSFGERLNKKRPYRPSSGPQERLFHELRIKTFKNTGRICVSRIIG